MPTNDFELTVPDLYFHYIGQMCRPFKGVIFQKRVFVVVDITSRKSLRTEDFPKIISNSLSECATFSESGSFIITLQTVVFSIAFTKFSGTTGGAFFPPKTPFFVMAAAAHGSSPRWVCFKCGEMAVDSEYLDVCFGDVNVSLVRDGPGGEYWLGCKECSQSFHVQCFLKEFTQDTWEEAVQGLETDINDHISEVPVDQHGKRQISDVVAFCMPPYLCTTW